MPALIVCVGMAVLWLEPRAASAAPIRTGDVIVCRLGSEMDVNPFSLSEAPMRQAVLLRKLGGRQLIALAR